MAEFLLELFSEEIPARMQARAAEDLQRLVGEGLKAAGLSFTKAQAFVTPRRLALVVDGLPLAQPDLTEEKRGPRDGAPQAAIDGFLKAAGLSSLDQCEKRDTGKGVFWFAVVEKKGRASADVLLDIVQSTLAQFPWPKSMRWGSGRASWVRPLQSILCLFDRQVVPVRFAGIEAGTMSRGHRFLAPDSFAVTDFADYRKKLEAAFVILDAEARKTRIKAELAKLAQAENLIVRDDPGLLDEVAGLVEWPVAYLGAIDKAFMDVPAEVLITSMRAHQKYFALETKDGKLAPRFGVIANRPTDDGGQAVVAGNERVLRARLSDARFFWELDRKIALETRLPKLAERLFYKGLGSMLDKATRLERLASELARFVPKADVAHVARAAKLAKADLSSGMVGEFPELQGVMGRYYALNDGEPLPIAQAIADHYAPAGPNDRCPTAPVSVAVALADKIDSLAGFWSIDEKPTGSKDPFALRRAALGVIRLLIENRLRLSLSKALHLAYVPFGTNLAHMNQTYVNHLANKFFSDDDKGDENFEIKWERGGNREKAIDKEGHYVAGDLLNFFADRLKVHLREKGTRHDLIDAVFALKEDDLVRLIARVEALAAFLASPDGANLLTAYKRAANILKIEEKKDGKSHTGAVDAAKLAQAEEKALARALAQAEGDLKARLEREDFQGAMAALAALRGTVDAFFDKVTVNADDPDLRANRLRLLSAIRGAMDHVADFSKIEG
ncbi:MAG: glycine--tRNA ligase subunit beta [Rhodospirillales bacterium]|nr:glycine--tRNA ligase subunit beta [Rhodospirillales bacterium]